MVEGYLPVMLKLQDKTCLVVGGGAVAERRIASLLGAGARVRVVSPVLSAKIRRWAADNRIEAILRRYRFQDQEGAYLVVAATDCAAVNEQVMRQAQSADRLVNMAERPELGNVIMPSVVRRGRLVIAVSTSGAAPAVAASISRQLQDLYGEEYEEYLDFFSEFRQQVRARIEDASIRQQWYQRVLDADVPGMIRNGQFHSWQRQLASQLIDHPQAPFAAELGGETCAKSW